MNMNINDFFKYNLMKPLTLNVGDKYRYKINMDNTYYDLSNGRTRVQQLHSLYTREISKNPVENVWFTNIKWDDVKFKNSQSDKWMNWSFPKKINFDSAVYRLPSMEEKNELFDGNPFSRQKEQHDNLEKAFSSLPKLPSVYLMIMQAFDIITFDSYMSIIHSNCAIMDNSGSFVRVDELSNQTNNIGIGKYNDESVFTNGEFFFKHLGYGVKSEIACAIYEYYCDNSKVKVLEGSDKNSKDGKSFYQGHLMLDVRNGNLIFGDMKESYIDNSNGNEVKKYVKRNISVEFIG